MVASALFLIYIYVFCFHSVCGSCREYLVISFLYSDGATKRTALLVASIFLELVSWNAKGAHYVISGLERTTGEQSTVWPWSAEATRITFKPR